MIFRHLEYLVALARERHFGRAAAACGVTQPTLSAAIRDLEAELDILIVERGQRFQGLTPEGERTLAWARRILADCEALRQDVSEARQTLSGHLVIGVIPTAIACLGIITSAFRDAHPDVRITILSMTSIDIQRGLDAFEIEAGITYLDNEPLAHVRALPLYQEHYYLMTSDPDLYRGRRQITWAEAAGVPLALLTPDMQNRRILETAFAAAGGKPEPVIEANSILALMSHVRNSRVATILTQTSQHLLGRPAWLRALPLVDPDVRRTIGLVTPDRDPQQPMTKALIDLAKRLDLDRLLLLA